MLKITDTGNRQSSAMITLHCVYYVLPLNALVKQYNKRSLVCSLMEREKIGRCHTLKGEKKTRLVCASVENIFLVILGSTR
jgi:hypothetical protein